MKKKLVGVPSAVVFEFPQHPLYLQKFRILSHPKGKLERQSSVQGVKPWTVADLRCFGELSRGRIVSCKLFHNFFAANNLAFADPSDIIGLLTCYIIYTSGFHRTCGRNIPTRNVLNQTMHWWKSGASTRCQHLSYNLFMRSGMFRVELQIDPCFSASFCRKNMWIPRSHGVKDVQRVIQLKCPWACLRCCPKFCHLLALQGLGPTVTGDVCATDWNMTCEGFLGVVEAHVRYIHRALLIQTNERTNKQTNKQTNTQII